MKIRLKFTLIICIVFAFMRCGQNKNSTVTNSSNFDWLVGKWQRTNEEAGKETFENWEKISDSEYRGIGFTIQNKDTVSLEQMKIAQMEGKWTLLIKTPDEKAFIAFKMSAIKGDKFEFKNDSLEFPSSIKYWKSNDKINALVSGGSLGIPYEFERKD